MHSSTYIDSKSYFQSGPAPHDPHIYPHRPKQPQLNRSEPKPEVVEVELVRDIVQQGWLTYLDVQQVTVRKVATI